MTSSKKTSPPAYEWMPTHATPAIWTSSFTATAASTPEKIEPSTPNIKSSDSFRPEIQSIHDDFRDYGFVANGATTDDATPTLSGRAQPNTQVEIHNQVGLIGYAMTSPDGTWTLTVPGPLPQGENQLKVVSEGVESDPFLITVHTPPADKPVIESAFDDFRDYGFVANGETTDDATPTLSGRAQPNTQVEIHNQVGLIGYAMTSPDGTWTFQVTDPLPQGENQLKVVTEGVESDPFLITVHTPPADKPVIESVFDDFRDDGLVANGATTDDATPTLWGRAQPNTQVEIHNQVGLIGYAMTSPDGTWTFRVTDPLPQGNNQFKVVSEGVESDPFVVNIETSAGPAPVPTPAAPVIDSVLDDYKESGQIANGGTTDDTSPTLKGRAEPGSVVSIYDQDGFLGTARVNPDGKWSFPISGPLPEGEYTFKVVSGGVESDPYVVNIETPADPAPVPTPAAPVIDSVFDGTKEGAQIANGGTTEGSTVTLNGRAQPNTFIEIQNQYGLIAMAQVDADGKWSYTITSSMHLGEQVFKVVSEGVESDPFLVTIADPKPESNATIDSATDNIGITAVLGNGDTTDDATPAFHGKGQPNSILSLYENDNFVASLYVDKNGNWSYTPNTQILRLSEGEHVFILKSDNENVSDPFILNVKDIPEVSKATIDSVTDNEGSWKGDVQSGATIDDNQPVLNGSGEPDAIVWVWSDDKLLGLTRVDDNGKWRFEIRDSDNLGPGEHSFWIDSDGGRSDKFILNLDEPAAPLKADSLQLKDVLSSNEEALFATDQPANSMEPVILKIDREEFAANNMGGSNWGVMESNPGIFNAELQRLPEPFETV